METTTKAALDKLCETETGRPQSTLVWLRQPAVSFAASAILQNIEKINFLQALGVAAWDLSGLAPNRLKSLARVACKSRVQALPELAEKKRYPLLVAFAQQTWVAVLDETVELCSRCLMHSYSKAGQELEVLRQQHARATNDKLHLFHALGRSF